MLMLIEIILGSVWDLLWSGWNRLKRWARMIIGDIARELMRRFGEMDSGEVPAQAAPGVARSELSAKASLPTKAPASAPAQVPSVPPPAPVDPVQPVPAAVAERSAASDKSDETALARMLSSDDGPGEVKLVRGWIAVQRQRARK